MEFSLLLTIFIVTRMKEKCLIIGSGAAGLTAAIYAGRAGLEPIVISGLLLGGQVTQTHLIENFPGYPTGIDGFQMMEDLMSQAKRFGLVTRMAEVTSVDFHRKTVTLDEKETLPYDALIIATGTTPRYLGLPEEESFFGSGLGTCATCDGYLYREKTVAVIGGGDTACTDALYLSGLAEKVYLVVRKTILRASQVLQEKVLATENIEILFGEEPSKILGGEVSGVTGLEMKSGKTLDLDGIFLAIGRIPKTDIFKGTNLGLTKDGYITVVPGKQETNILGVYAAGDVSDPTYQQAIIAAGSGAKAAMEAIQYLKCKNE